MANFIPIIIIITVLLGIIGIITVIISRKKMEEIKRTGKYPEGHFLGVGIGIGMGIGIPLGLILGISTDNIALGISIGPALGCGIGVAIGSHLEKKHKKNIRPLTEKEKKIKKLGVIIAGSLVLLGLITLITIFLMLK